MYVKLFGKHFYISLAINYCNIFSYWKRLWRWTTSQFLTKEEIEKIYTKEVVEGLKNGLISYKPKEADAFASLQSKYPDQTKLLSVAQTLQNYMVS